MERNRQALHLSVRRHRHLGNLDSDDDVDQYDSSEFQFIGFDELTSFSEQQYTYLFSRLRATKDNPVPLRMRSASNPRKLRTRLGQGALHDRPTAGGATARLSHALLPPGANRRQSPHRGDVYLASLANLEPVRRRQLLEGDWEVSPRGNLFRREWFVIEEDWPREVTGTVRAWDDAATRDGGDWSVGVLMAMTRIGIAYIIDVVRIQGSPLEVERLKVSTAHGDALLTNRRAVVLLQKSPVPPANHTLIRRYVGAVVGLRGRG